MKKYILMLSIIFCSSLQSESFNLNNVIQILLNTTTINSETKTTVIEAISKLEPEKTIYINNSNGGGSVTIYKKSPLYWPSTLTLLCIPATFLFTRWYYTGKIL